MAFQIVKLLGNPVQLVFTGGINPRGTYNAGTAYATGDSVSYSGSSYVAIQATTGNLPTNTTYWQLLAQGNASSVTFVDNEVVSGSGSTFTLAHTPTVGTEHIYGLGQRLIPGDVDYTISGATITTINSWSADQILADYRY